MLDSKLRVEVLVSTVGGGIQSLTVGIWAPPAPVAKPFDPPSDGLEQCVNRERDGWSDMATIEWRAYFLRRVLTHRPMLGRFDFHG